ncbi:MAG: DNA-processing protein DprA [Acidobacteriota bacterium]
MKNWIALNMTPGIGPRAVTVLLERFGSPEAVFNATRRELQSVRLIPAAIDSIIEHEFEALAEKELHRTQQLGGAILTLDDPDYPDLLKEISDPPPVIYVLGEWKSCFDSPGVGVVGSRRASTYGENAAFSLSQELGRLGVCIVSGLARGIDTAAHRGALAGNGKTVAVMGTGLDSVYPRENSRLVEEILKNGGAVITQFPFGTPPLKDNFPYRNRMISGISHALVVVEATERSGSLITARLAMEQNREVMAVPGNITSRNSFGTNYLIKSGAKLIQQGQDVLAELPRDLVANLLTNVGENNPTTVEPNQSFSKEVVLVLRHLGTDNDKSIDDLVEETGLRAEIVSSAILELEIAGAVRTHAGSRYSRSLGAN